MATKNPAGRAAQDPKSAGPAAPPAQEGAADGTAMVATTEAPARAPMPVPAGGWPPDEFSGLAGRFVRDPYTGVRRRAE